MREAPSTRPVGPADREAFLAWAAEVEALFGPMIGVPGFERALDAALEAGAGFVAEPAGGPPLGGVLIDRAARAIAWLVVGAAGRGHGAGGALVDAALAALGPGPVRVETFAEGVPAGVAALSLYARAGFRPTGETGVTPAGIPTQVLVRP